MADEKPSTSESTQEKAAGAPAAQAPAADKSSPAPAGQTGVDVPVASDEAAAKPSASQATSRRKAPAKSTTSRKAPAKSTTAAKAPTAKGTAARQAAPSAAEAKASAGRSARKPAAKAPETAEQPIEDASVRINKATEDTLVLVKNFTTSMDEAAKSNRRMVIDNFAEAARGFFTMQHQLAETSQNKRVRDAADTQIRFAEDVTEAWVKAARKLLE